MGSTFLQLTNQVIRRINEVELDSMTFNSARGVQATIKDAVNASISKIQSKIPALKYMAYEHTQVLTPGTYEYAWPNDMIQVEKRSFQLQESEPLAIGSKTLQWINTNEWYGSMRDMDVDAGVDGRDVPSFAGDTHGQGYFLTPSPNEAYTLKFRYFALPVALAAHGDQTNIPSNYDYVIVAGALRHMFRFRDNDPRTQDSKEEFREGLQDMDRNLVKRDLYFTDARVVPIDYTYIGYRNE